LRVPLSWLRDFAPFDAPNDAIADALSNLGLVVEGVEAVGGGLEGVVVARVAAIRPHPDADRIRLVDVDAGGFGGEDVAGGDAGRGAPARLQVACGAWNFEVGDLVPLATVGAVLPGGPAGAPTVIGRRKMRGEWSNGMLCAADELGLPEPRPEPGSAPEARHGILVLPAGLAAPGTPLVDALDLRPDVVFDLEVSPNRADALSVAGVARDLAAAFGLPFSLPPAPGIEAAGVEAAGVEVSAADLCPRFTATVVTGLPAGASPPWLARRLILAGMRPINRVVDASNYVMLELGQPNHPYDLDKLAGRGLLVRRSRAGETLTTLDGVERTLGGDDCLICDADGEPVGIGGIMGGASAEITEATTTVLLEAAWFSPAAIVGTGVRIGLSTEARSRFEKGVDPEIAPAAVSRFVSLLEGARRGPTTDVRSPAHLPVPPVVPVRTARVKAILGIDLADSDVARILAPLGFADAGAGVGADDPAAHDAGAGVVEGVTRVAVPSWRPDVTREIDVIEELARLHGYSRIKRTLPPGVRSGGGLNRHQRGRRFVRDILAGAGLSEAWTTTFLAPSDLERAGLDAVAVEVANPLDSSESILRTSLLPGLLKALRYNADRQSPDVRLFEIGRVFAPPAGEDVLPLEREEIAVVVAGAGADARLAVRIWMVLAGALRLDGVTLEAAPAGGLHPTRSAMIVSAGGEVVGTVGEVAREVVAAYGLSGRVGFWHADLTTLLALPRRIERAPGVSRFPASDFDVAFVVPAEEPAAAVAATLERSGGDLLESIHLFDVYPMPARGPGARSLAYRLRLRAADRTLTDAEVAEIRRAVIDAVAGAHRGELRH
jgi:phenylalanyl-tRNA synthetase beta chain